VSFFVPRPLSIDPREVVGAGVDVRVSEADRPGRSALQRRIGDVANRRPRIQASGGGSVATQKRVAGSSSASARGSPVLGSTT
jgi:hypothetical protein